MIYNDKISNSEELLNNYIHHNNIHALAIEK